MSDIDHAAKIKETTDSIRLRIIAYPDCGGNLVPNHLDDIDDDTDALQRERDEARAELAARRARVLPSGLALKSGNSKTFPVLWKWSADWDWCGATSIADAIDEAERRLWKPKQPGDLPEGESETVT